MERTDDWARDHEAQMRRGVFADRTEGERATFHEIIKRYMKELTANRPGEKSRKAEKARLERFLHEEVELCSYAVANLRAEHFEEWRDRRLTTNLRKKVLGEALAALPGRRKQMESD